MKRFSLLLVLSTVCLLAAGELLARGGAYAHLFTLQAQAYR